MRISRIRGIFSEKVKGWFLSADGVLFFPFGKGGDIPLFSLPKRKKFQKRSWRPCRSNACEYGSRIAQSSVVSARTPARAQNCPLAENAEVFGRHSVLWKALIVWNFFLLVRRRDCFSPKSLFYSLGACTAVPLSVVLVHCPK